MRIKHHPNNLCAEFLANAIDKLRVAKTECVDVKHREKFAEIISESVTLFTLINDP